MGQIIDGRDLAEKIHDQTAAEIFALGERPNLAIILVGGRPDSVLYAGLKEKKAKEVGVDTHLYKCDEDIDQAELLSIIDCLNQDETIDAILVQLPLPAELDTDAIISAIDPAKDVDRFHPANTAKLQATCDHDEVMPPLYATVLQMLSSVSCDLPGKKALIVGNSDIFLSGLSKVLSCRGAETESVRPDDPFLSEKTVLADVLIVAVGRPSLIGAEMVKEGAVVIDIGVNKVSDKVCGDVDTEAVLAKASFATPVPGGVGPLTIAMLFRNTLALYKERQK